MAGPDAGGQPQSFTPNALNQYAAIDTTRTPTYDLSGNMVDDGAGRTFSFDSENRLMSGTKSPDAWFEYDYDPFGRRVLKYVEEGCGVLQQRYVYDGPHCIAETDMLGTIERKYIYGPGIDEPLMMIVVDGETETKYYYHRDALGNVMALSNAAGNIVEGYTYSAFGIAKVNYSAGPDGDWLTPDGATCAASFKGNPYMFTGRRYDWETGLYYYRARYYDATLGRFISADPISYAGGINLYAYVMNNPIMFTDPMGLWRDHDGDGEMDPVPLGPYPADPVKPAEPVKPSIYRIYIAANRFRLHQMLVIDNPGGDSMVYEFGCDPYNIWRIFGNNGTITAHVYDDEYICSGYGFEVTPDQAEEALLMMNDLIGMHDHYSLICGNCRGFAQGWYDVFYDRYHEYDTTPYREHQRITY